MSSPKIVLSGMGAKLTGLHWETNKVLRIGRQDNVDVAFQDSSVDRLQAEVRWSGGRWIIRDLSQSAAYPTLQNGKVLARGDQPLMLEDVLQFGKNFLKVTLLEGGKPATAPVAPLEVTADEAITAEARNIPASSLAPAENDKHPSTPATPTPTHDISVIPIPTSAPAGSSRFSPVPRQESIKTSGAFVKVQARTHQSWDQALELVTLWPEQGAQQRRGMLTLLRANHHLVHLDNLEELLGSILQDAIAAAGAQRGSIALFKETTGQLELKANQAPGLASSVKWVFSKTLAERCFRLGESILCQDVNADNDLLMARSVRQGAMASIICALLRTPRKRIGILQIDRGPFQEPFTESDLYLMDALAASAAFGIESAQLVEQQRDEFVQTVSTLARAVEMRDQYTGEHTRRVTDYALMLADELKLSATEKYQIQIGTPLHDIGKIGIDDSILRKPGKLSDGEYRSMQDHTIKGASMLESIAGLKPMIPIVRNHHERWDGTGYPDRLAEKAISTTARIVAVADAFDAMTTLRPYRPAMPTEVAFTELLKNAGTHFDPTCVQAFLRQRRKVEQLVAGK